MSSPPTGDRRGGDRTSLEGQEQKTANILDINAHIQSYGPTISHYRRVYVPNRLYLDSSLSIATIYKDFIEGGSKCQYAMYRKQIMEKNISFVKLGTEECVDCLEFDNHPCSRNRDNKTPQQQQQQQQQIFEVCVTHKLHVTNDKNARMSDSSKVNTVEESYFSVNLLKVVMLLLLPGVKTVAFTKRIISYNETFAPLGDKRKLKTNTMCPYAMTWHDAIGGRSVQKIAFVFKEFIVFHLEVKEHCRTGYNKNEERTYMILGIFEMP